MNFDAGLTELQGFGIEVFLGFVLVLTVFGVVDPNRPDAKAAGPLAIGVAVAVGHLAAVDFTGSSMNPARSFGSALIAGNWTSHWVITIRTIVILTFNALRIRNENFCFCKITILFFM